MVRKPGLHKEDMGYFVIFLVLFLLMARGGIQKYFVLLALSCIFVAVKRKIDRKSVV